MAIIVSTNVVRKDAYPKMMVYQTGAIILFTSKNVGTCVKGDDVTPLGHHSNGWGEEETLSDFSGSVTLSSEG